MDVTGVACLVRDAALTSSRVGRQSPFQGFNSVRARPGDLEASLNGVIIVRSALLLYVCHALVASAVTMSRNPYVRQHKFLHAQ